MFYIIICTIYVLIKYYILCTYADVHDVLNINGICKAIVA